MKKILLKTKQLALLFLGLSVILAACEPKPKDDSYGSGNRKSGVEKKIDENIKLLSKEMNWAKSQELYGKIKSDIGNKEFNLKPRVQNDLFSLVDKAFCHSMDTIMFDILSGECKPRHDELSAVHKRRSETSEFSKVAATAFHSQVESMYAEHKNMRKSILPELKRSKLKVTSYETAYETKYEKEAVAKAENYLSKNPTCLEIKEGLTRVKEGKVFDSWRIAYCQAVVDSYCEQFGDPTNTWLQKYENITLGNIGFYTNKHSSDPQVQEWLQRIAEVKNMHQ